MEAQAEVGVLLVEEVRRAEAAELPPRRPGGSPGRRRRGRRPPRVRRERSPAARPAPPAQAMPVKWTTPPRLLSRAPPSSVTSPCQASQPRPSTSGSSIASRKPGATTLSGLRKSRSSPPARAAPALQAAPNPGLPSSAIRTASRRQLGDHARRVVGRSALSQTISSSPGAELGDDRGQAAPQRLGRVVGDDDDRERRVRPVLSRLRSRDRRS